MSLERCRATARDELFWLFGGAEADACGLKAVTWNVLEEVEKSRTASGSSGPGVKRGAPPMVDPHPDTRSRERQRLRTIYAAFVRVPHAMQAQLEAYFTPSGQAVGRASSALGGEWSALATQLPEVQRAAARTGRSRLVEVRLLVAQEGSDVVRLLCQAVLGRALDAYVGARFPQLAIAAAASRLS